MICPNCKKEGKRSKVTSFGGSVTLMGWQPFWDEDGKAHYHDPNIHSSQYNCSNGHTWKESKGGSCWCGWEA